MPNWRKAYGRLPFTLMKTALSTLRAFVGRILRRFVEEDFFQLSAGLAFTTLLALVPLVAVVFGIMSVFPFFLDMAVQIVQKALCR